MMEQYLPIREEFAKKASQYTNICSQDNNSFGGFILGDDSYLNIGRWVCHGWLSEYNMLECHTGRNRYKTHGIKYVLSAVMKPHTTDDIVRLFIDWLINRSPWAHMHMDKDVDSVLRLGYMVDANYAPEAVTSGFIASRLITESYSSPDDFAIRCLVWKELIDIGCTENEAFFFAHMYKGSGKKDLYPITFNRMQSGHSTFHGCNYQENYIKSFLNASPVNLSGRLLSRGEGYHSYTINSIWGKTTDKDSFAEKVQNFVPVRKALKVDHHIFRKAPKQGFSYKSREDFASVIHQLKECLNA